MVEASDDTYRLIREEHGEIASPRELLLELKKEYGIVYVLDIDGMERNEPNLKFIQQSSPLIPMWVDAGSIDNMGVMDILVAGISKAVVSTKSMHDLILLEEAYEMSDNIILSIDFDEKILSPSQHIPDLGVRELSRKAADIGIREVIFFDFGRMSGKTRLALDKIRTASQAFENVYVAGISSPEDISQLEELDITGIIANFRDLRAWGIEGTFKDDEEEDSENADSDTNEMADGDTYEEPDVNDDEKSDNESDREGQYT